jgi:tRNA threonylcarbamoyladenosine biosynthesis protein TsaE
MEINRISNSEEETLEFGEELSKPLVGGETIFLEGSLGMGKTVLAKGIAKGLGIDERDVVSPSFVLVKEYGGGRLALFHVDLYRLSGTEEIEGLGLEEISGRDDAVILVEWGEKLTILWGEPTVLVRFDDLGGTRRRIRVYSSL